MNKPFNILAILNSNLNKVNTYSEDKEIQAKRETVFDIVKNHNAVKKDKSMYRGHMASSHYNYEGYAGNYTQAQAVEKINQLENTIKDGWVYSWDTETMGQPKAFNSKNINKADKLNNGIFSITELGMYKQQYKDGNAIGDLEKVIDFTSSHDRTSLTKYTNEAMGNKTMANKVTLSTMTRIAGYSDPNNFVKDEKLGKMVISGWNGSAKINDTTVIGSAITALTGDKSSGVDKGVQYLVGTKEYNKEVSNIYNTISEILNSDNSILNSMNGINFDNPVLKEFFENAGIKLEDGFLDKLNNKTFDTQQVLRGTSKSTITKLLNKAKVSVNMKVETLIHAANQLGAKIGKSDSHVATNDAKNTSKILNSFLPEIFGARDRIVADNNKKVPVSTKAIYHATSAVRADDNDIFFSDNGYDNPNTYNPILMEPGHSYSLESYSFNSKDLPKELKEKMKEFKGKKILKMEDMHEGYNRSSYLVVDKQSNIQDKLLDSGSIISTEMNDKTSDLIRTSTEAAFNDKARQTRDNFYRVNSDKGIADFETYLSSYKNYATNVDSASKENLSSSLKSGVIKGYSGSEIATKDALNRLFTRGEDGTLVHERAFNLVNMYNDLESNYDLYSSMIKASDDAVGSYDSFIYNNNLGDNQTSKILHNKTRTAALATIKENLNSSIMDVLGEEEILDHVINNNESLSKMVSSRLKKRSSENGVKLNSKVSSEVKRNAFEDYFGEGFSKNSKHAQAYVFGKKEIKDTLKDFEGIDIKNPNGEYSRVQINDKNNFSSSLKNMLFKVKAENNIPQATDNLRRNYLDSVVKNLHERGLINDSVRESFNSTDTIQGMTDIITNGIYDTKGKFDGLVTPGKTVNYDKMSPEDFKFVRNYINNSKPNTIYSESDGFTVMGQSANDFVNSRLNNTHNGMVEVGKGSVPNFVTYSSSATTSEFGKERMGKILSEEFGWTKSNIDKFMSGVINNEDLNTFEYATSGKKVNGLSHSIASQNGISYLISTPFDKQAIVADKIARGANLSEINNLAVMWRIPKVEDLGGVRVIKQGVASYKAVTRDLIVKKGKLSGTNEWRNVLDVEDTIDQVINGISGKYGFSEVKKLMEQGSYQQGTKKLGRSWTKINTNKTLSSITTRFKKGEKGARDSIYKEATLNRADYALPGMVDVSDLVYGLDGIEQNDKLYRSLMDTIGDPNDVKDIIKEIKGVKGKIDGDINTKYSKKTFDKWDTTFKLWFSDNISEVAKEVISNKGFSEYNPEALEILKSIQSVGTDGFFGKESGDANRGFFFLTPPKNFVAGSSFSGTSRPIINQVMSALNVFPEDMIGLSKTKLPHGMRKNINTINDLESKLGIRMGHGYMTKDAIEYSNMVRELNKGEIGFTTKVKFMDSNTFLDKLDRFHNMSKDEFTDFISSNSHFSEALKETGVGIDNVTLDYIKKIAKNISTATNIYEDSSLISPLLGQILSPKTITSVKFDGDSSRFKVGNMLNPGDILFKNNGKKNDKNRGKIVHIEDDKIFIQLNSNYNNAKIGFGGSEKTEGMAPVVNSIKKFKKGEEAAMAHALIRELSGGANIISNPDLIKHESFNTLLSGYFNAIGDEIDDTNLNSINESLKNHLSNANMEYTKDGNGRYILSEGSKTGKVSIYDFDNFIDEIKSKNITAINNNINDLENNHLMRMDISTMQDNTIEGYQGADNISKGAAINFRSQSVMGAFIGDENIEELSKYRKIKDGQIENLWQPLIDNDIEQLAGDSKFIRSQEQVQNIRVALAASSGEMIPDSKISKFSLDMGAVGSSTMTAETMPEIFKFSNKGNRIHGYEIDVSDLNVNIENPIYKKLEKYGMIDIAEKNNIQKYVDKIFIPALDANHIDDEYILSQAQRKASDLINEINRFRNGDFGDQSIEKASEVLSYKYRDHLDALRFELVSKEGLNERSQKIKSNYSARMKASNVAAPITRKNGFTYKDINFAKTSTLEVNGKKKYYGSVFTSLEDFSNKGVSIHGVGKQLIEENLDDSVESLNVLKKHFKELQSVKDMAEARKVLKGNKINKKTYKAIGEDFLRDVGIVGAIMRDPAMKSTSYQAVRIRASGITQGTMSIDAVIAKLMNADVDGDELNLFFRGLTSKGKGKNKRTKLRNLDDIEVKTIKDIMERQSNYNLQFFKNEISNYKEKAKTTSDIKSYVKEMKKIGREIDDLDYFKGDIKHTGLFARFSKSSIGQISNPNYYLRAASNSYFARNPYDLNSYKGLSAINSLTDIAEQKLIDSKSIKNKKNTIDSALLAASYRQAMDDIASKDKDINKNALTTMYKNLLTVTDLDGEGPLTLGYDKKILSDNLDEAVEQAIQRMLKGNPYKSNSGTSFTLEESLYYTNQILQDNQSADLFFSSYIRQSDVKSSHGKFLNELEKQQRAIHQIIDPNNKLAALSNGYNYLDSTVDLNGQGLSVGENLYSTKSSNGISEGIFKVSSIRRDGTNNFINLMDTDTNKITTINGSSFKSISEKISHMQRHNDGVNFQNLLSKEYQSQLTSSLNGFYKVDSISKSSNIESVKYKSAKAAMNSINIDNLNDVLNTSAVLNSKGFISDDDAALFIKSMNENIKKNNTSDYHQAKMKNLLGLKSLKKNAKVSSIPSLNSLLTNEVTEESISKVRGSAKISDLKAKVNSLSRVNVDKASSLGEEKLNEYIKNNDKFSTMNLDKINDIRNSTMGKVVSSVAENDKGIIRELKEIFSNNSEDLNFITDVLGLKLEEVKNLIDNNAGAEAIDVINSSKISYGEYIGFNIGELEDSALNKIISSEYDTTGISSEVVNRTTETIKYSQSLKESGHIRDIKQFKLNGQTEESITKIMYEMNENITSNGGNSKGLTGKSIIDKMSDLGSKAKGNKKFILGSLATAGIVVAGSYLYGNAKMNEKDEQFVSKNSDETYKENIIKQEAVGTDTNSSYDKVPNSNKKFYGNNKGITVNVSGKATSGADVSNLNILASRIFGGSNASINTTISDSRKEIEDRDVESIMSQATRII